MRPTIAGHICQLLLVWPSTKCHGKFFYFSIPDDGEFGFFIGSPSRDKIFRNYITKNSKKWKKKEPSKKLGEGNIITRAEGGPIQAGQPAIVGEKGPEVIVPNADANVISNDDSQVMGMLLASNPQLQNVSKARAESILRSRFPDYFA